MGIQASPHGSSSYDVDEALFHHCGECGWWIIREDHWFTGSADGTNWPRAFDPHIVWPVLRSYDLTSSEMPVTVLRQHLLKKYSDVRVIDAGKAEELVLSVFKEVYRDAEVRYFRGYAYTPDDGIDIAVANTGEGSIAIQVKRRLSRAKEPVESVRSFVGAILLNGFRRGVYVALSSCFTDTALKIPSNENLRTHGFQLRLIDADEFYHMLSAEALSERKPVWYSLLKEYEDCEDNAYITTLLEAHAP